MRVAILTNMDEQCGNYQYAADLGHWLSQYHDVLLVDSIPKEPMDLVFINWHPARVSLTTELVEGLQAKGAKVIIIHQNSSENGVNAIGPKDPLKLADGIVCHEPMESDNLKVTYIPHGIRFRLEDTWKVPLHREFTIGTAGFAFPWKRADLIPEAARRVNGRAVVIAAPHEFYNVNAEAAIWKNVCLDNNLSHDIFTEWWEAKKVIMRLAQSHVNIFWFESKDIHDTFGQTGSARLGVAAGRPMIISRHRKFRTILDFEDEFYVAEKESDVFRLVQEIKEGYGTPWTLRRPKRILVEQGWAKCAVKYDDLIKEVCGADVAYNAT